MKKLMGLLIILDLRAEPVYKMIVKNITTTKK